MARHQRQAAAAYGNDDLFVFIWESITALLFISACLETNDLLISLVTSLWTAEMDGLNKEVDSLRLAASARMSGRCIIAQPSGT